MGHWVNGQKAQIEQRMDISPQQQPVGNVIGFGSPVSAKVGAFKGRGRIKARDGAPSPISF